MKKRKKVVIENTFAISPEKLWKAITDKYEMKKWYFDLEEFRPEVGFEFRFWGGTEDRQYLHICKITEVELNNKIAYSWKYDGIEGATLVCFEIIPVTAEKSILKLTHTGFETFPSEYEDLTVENFEKGWAFILGTSLKNYLKQ